MRHIPTGLFFTPSKGSGNLSVKGKTYVDRIPDIKWGNRVRLVFYTDKMNKNKKILATCFNIDTSVYKVDKSFETLPEDWEIVKL
jgi:hypothetical protein